MSATQPIIRRAEERDRADLEGIANRTWNGGDYLSRVITDWLAEQHGEFFVAELAGQVIGSGKLTRYAADEWWLEGLRVHPDFQGRGIGTLLHQYAVQQADAQGTGSLRLSTDEDNTAVQRMAVQTGFVPVARYLRYETSTYAHGMGAAQFQQLTAEQVLIVRPLLEKSPYYQLAQHSTLARRWKAHLITDVRLQEWAAAGQVYAWQYRGASGVIIADAPSPVFPQQLQIIYADVQRGNFATMLRASRGLGGQLGWATLRYLVPVEPDLLVAIEQAGWRRPKDNGGRAVLLARQIVNHQS